MIYPITETTAGFWPAAGPIPFSNGTSDLEATTDTVTTYIRFQAVSDPGVDPVDPTAFGIRQGLYIYDPAANEARLIKFVFLQMDLATVVVEIDLEFTAPLAATVVEFVDPQFRALTIASTAAWEINGIAQPAGATWVDPQTGSTTGSLASVVTYDDLGTPLHISISR